MTEPPPWLRHARDHLRTALEAEAADKNFPIRAALQELTAGQYDSV